MFLGRICYMEDNDVRCMDTVLVTKFDEEKSIRIDEAPYDTCIIYNGKEYHSLYRLRGRRSTLRKLRIPLEMVKNYSIVRDNEVSRYRVIDNHTHRIVDYISKGIEFNILNDQEINQSTLFVILVNADTGEIINANEF